MSLILHDEKDPFGRAMRDYQASGRNRLIKVESDIAVDDFIPTRYLFRAEADMPAWELAALDACRGRVLDIGAGAGSHSLVLQNRGLEVVAIDISPGAIDVMQARGLKQVWHADFFTHPPERFDTLLLMMNGIGIVGDLKGLNTFLLQAKSWLRPHGQIILDSSDISYLYEQAEDAIMAIPGRYKGIIQFKMSYQGVLGDPFYWLYIDYPRLQKHADVAGYKCTLLAEGSHHEYLARLELVGLDGDAAYV